MKKRWLGVAFAAGILAGPLFWGKGESPPVDPLAFTYTVSVSNYAKAKDIILLEDSDFLKANETAAYFERKFEEIEDSLRDCDDSFQKSVKHLMVMNDLNSLIQTLKERGNTRLEREDKTKQALDGVYLEIKSKFPCPD